MSTLTLRLEAYAKDARQVIAGAQTLADDRENTEVEPLHVLYRLMERETGPQEAVRRAGVDPADVLVECEAQVRRLARLPDAVAYLSPRLLDLLLAPRARPRATAVIRSRWIHCSSRARRRPTVR